MKPKTWPKVMVILGPTASGKTALAVTLARQFKGEIVSADSRQVYRGLDVGSGKVLKEYGDVPYHLIGVADSLAIFDLARYQKMAYEAIDDILKRGRLPIVCGGSGLYLQAVVDGYQLPATQPDAALRDDLTKKSLAQLQNLLAERNPSFFAKLNNSDKNNQRRLIRYCEILMSPDAKTLSADHSPYDFLLLGLAWPQEILAERITRRLRQRLDEEDLVEEVRCLEEGGVSWQRLESFGLEYKFIAQYLQEKIDYETMFKSLNTAIKKFASRQMTWFRRWTGQGREIVWLEDKNEALDRVEKFLRE